MDKLLWNHIIREILLLVLLVLSAFPVLMNKMVLYIVYIYTTKRTKKDKELVKKRATGRREFGGFVLEQVVQNGAKHITKC